MTNIPRFLRAQDGRTVAQRPRLYIDEVSENATVLDILQRRPLYRTKLIKKLKRRIAEFEELRAFAESKGDKALSEDKLRDILGIS